MTAITFEMILTLSLVIMVFIIFAKEIMPPDVAALSAAAILMVFGIITTDEILSVFSNPATATVASMFILSAALERTGVVERMANSITRFARKFPSIAVLSLMAAAMTASVFANNTSVVVIMTPVVISLAHTLKRAPSKFLIPLSYTTILAGTCTLIGSSTNILVDAVAREQGLEPFGMFEITMPGLILAFSGAAYLLIIGRKLLPERQTLTNVFEETVKRKFLTEIMIPEDSPLIGKTLKEAGISRERGFRVIDIASNTPEITETGFLSVFDKLIRKPGNTSPARLSEKILQAGDRIVLLTDQKEIVGMRENDKVAFESDVQKMFKKISTDEAIFMEGIVGPGSRLEGKYIGDLNLRNKYGVIILAVHRQSGVVSRNLDQVRLSFGDTLLLEGPPKGIKKLFDERDLINLSKPEEEPYRREKAPIAIAAIFSVLVFGGLGLMPIAGLAIVAALIVILFGCLEADEAYNSVEWKILMLIFGMLAISIGMQKTGAASLIVSNVMHAVDGFGPFVALSIVYLTTSILTETFSNNAAAVIITPIAIGIAHQMGVDPRPFAVAVMFGASASFATPIGYQTNTFVYHAGGYKFSDFVKVGLPMNILMWMIATIVIPYFWPLHPAQ